MFEYFAVLRVAASSAAEPASRAAAATYESADGQMTVYVPGQWLSSLPEDQRKTTTIIIIITNVYRRQSRCHADAAEHFTHSREIYCIYNGSNKERATGSVKCARSREKTRREGTRRQD